MSLRIGILGAARVATYAVIDAARTVEGVVVHGVAARDPERARIYAAEHGISRVYENYQAIIDAPDVDAVYNALPPNLHRTWSIAALEAGKPVLCEKPFALCVQDVMVMLEAEQRTGRLLMEAQHSHYHPLNARVREIMRSGILGKIKTAAAHFSVTVKQSPGEIRYSPDVGGGALWDLGVYPAYWLRSAFGEEPEIISASQILADTGADIETRAELRFPSCSSVSLSCAMHGDFAAWLKVEGDIGSLTVMNPLAPQSGHSLILTIAGTVTEESYTKKSTYAFQLEAFRDAVVGNGAVPTRGKDSLATMILLENIQRCAVKISE